MNENPFSLNFGKTPYRLISRNSYIDEIVDTFNSSTPSSFLYIVTGVRGSGKTVTMASVVNRIKNDDNWIAISLNPNRDLLTSLAAELYEHPLLKAAFIKANIGFSFGFSASLTTEGPPADIEVQLKKMLAVLKKLNKKVLIAIDEVTNSTNMRVFASSYQMLLYEEYPVFLIMTGLYANIKSLQDEKSLTFLYRAPKYELKPLSINTMANNYKDIF
ncbi:MAG: AAA family ATPase, partial [Lachnospiraceae bacterium]|nr:AAA family ATPase [Lachnospiraceae bacterium]